MKRIILHLATILLLFAACDKNCLNLKEKPKNLKPIDWENYNDVNTVYWNLYSFEGEMVPVHTEIMVYGWVHYQDGISARGFTLVDDPNIILDTHGRPKIDVENGFVELQAMFDTNYLTKRCFVKGKLFYSGITYGFCNIIEPGIYVTDINDIYFE